MRKLLLLLSILITIPVTVLADFETNKNLVDYCNAYQRILSDEQINPEDVMKGGRCIGYVEAVYDTAGKVIKDENHKICHIPQNIKSGEVIKNYLTWVEHNPKKLDLSASSGITLSIGETFCSWKPTP